MSKHRRRIRYERTMTRSAALFARAAGKQRLVAERDVGMSASSKRRWAAGGLCAIASMSTAAAMASTGSTSVTRLRAFAHPAHIVRASAAPPSVREVIDDLGGQAGPL